MAELDDVSFTHNPSVADALDAIMAVMPDAFEAEYGEAWNAQQVLGMLVSPLCHVIIAYCGDQNAIGFTMSRRTADEEELLLIGVRSPYQRKGVGRLLMDKVIIAARDSNIAKIFLEVRINNAASSFYKQLHFNQIGHRPKYYTAINGQRFDALTLVHNVYSGSNI